MAIIKSTLRAGFSLLVKNSPAVASKLLYYKTFGQWLDLKNPTTFNEKLMWLKLNEDDSLKEKCTDKYLVRDYIKELGFSNILIDLYKVYDRVEDIDFQELPNSFVMKCTHGSGFNIICADKAKLDQEKTINQLKKWMKTDYSLLNCEPHYAKIQPRIIVERFLEGNGKAPVDYKIHCFHGEPLIIELELNHGTPENKEIMLDNNWDILPYNEDSYNFKGVIDKPDKADEMLEISRKLSNEFSYVRVDLYFSNKEIYFGELTFTPAACLDTDLLTDSELQMGNLLVLSKS